MPIVSPSLRIGAFTNHFRVHLRAELKELYAFELLYSFAYALITIFEPVFFYKEGFSLAFIALYYALHYSIYVFLLPLGGKFAAKYGLEKSLSLSMPIFVAYFLTLAGISYNHDLVWLAIPLLTLHKIFYWPAFHTTFSKFGDKHNRGTEISWMATLKYGVGILGPLVGGFIAARFGFPVLFTLAATLVLFAAVPILRTKERYRVSSFSYAEPWKLMRVKRHRNMVKAMSGMGENLVDMVFWPVFMFIILGSTEKLGLFASLAIAIMALFSFLVGEMADRMPRQYVLRMHVPFLALSHLFRPLAITPLQVILTDTFSKISFVGVNLPMLYRLYVQGRATRTLSYVISFEMVLAIAKALTAFALVIVFSIALPYTGFVTAFVMAAAFAFLYMFL